MNGSQQAGRSAETVYSSKTLAQFLTLLFSRPSAEMIDLGPGGRREHRVSRGAHRLKIHVEDLYADLDRHASPG